jgi:hypothetical protein
MYNLLGGAIISSSTEVVWSCLLTYYLEWPCDERLTLGGANSLTNEFGP